MRNMCPRERLAAEIAQKEEDVERLAAEASQNLALVSQPLSLWPHLIHGSDRLQP
jgi:hypothetical protein